MKKILLSLTIVFSFYAASGQWNWIQKASMPADGRESTGYFTIGNDLYVVCGRTSISPQVDVDELWKYNTLTDTWTQKADYPGGARTSPLAFAINGKGYVVSGGYPEMHNDCWQYDPGTDAWVQKNNFPGAGRYTAAHFVLDNKVYMVGGYFNGTQTNEVWVYNSLTDVWIKLNNFPGGTVQGAIGFEIGGHGYIVGGVTGHSNYVALNKAWKYDEEYDQWDTIPSYPGEARATAIAFIKDGRAYVGLGANAAFSTHYSDFYGYDPVLNSWVPGTPLPAPGRRHGVGVNIGESVFVGTGVSGPRDEQAPATFFNDLYSIDAPVGLSDVVMKTKQMSLVSTFVSDKLEINLSSANEITIRNITGQVIWHGFLEAGFSEIPLNNVANGCYMVSAPGIENHTRFLVAH